MQEQTVGTMRFGLLKAQMASLLGLIAVVASAKLPEVTLDQMTKYSQLILRGKVRNCLSGHDKEICSIAPITVLKGSESGLVEICNDTTFSESVSLRGIIGHEVILFLGKAKNRSCWYIVREYRGLVQVQGEYSFPGVISDLPEKLPAIELEDAIRKKAQEPVSP